MNRSQRKPPIRAANDLSILLRLVLGEDRFPVDVKALAYEKSKNEADPIVRIEAVDIDGFDGMLRARRKKPGWQILVNTATPYPGRERFTLAHEFGHYVLHRRPLTLDDYPDGRLRGSVDFQCLPLQANAWTVADKDREEEADTFASYLLMPIDDYRTQVSGQEITRDLLGHVTDRYGVSMQAAVRKWIEFTEKRAAMVVARDGFALWGRASSAAYRSGVFIRSGMPIPGGSIAAQGPAAQQTQAERAIPLPAGVWTFSRGSEPVRELTIFCDRLGMSVSILLFERDFGSGPAEDEEPWDTDRLFLVGGQS